MNITTLRAALPRFDIENDAFDVGYFLRVAGEKRPRVNSEKQLGWDVANDEMEMEQNQ